MFHWYLVQPAANKDLEVYVAINLGNTCLLIIPFWNIYQPHTTACMPVSMLLPLVLSLPFGCQVIFQCWSQLHRWLQTIYSSIKREQPFQSINITRFVLNDPLTTASMGKVFWICQISPLLEQRLQGTAQGSHQSWHCKPWHSCIEKMHGGCCTMSVDDPYSYERDGMKELAEDQQEKKDTIPNLF